MKDNTYILQFVCYEPKIYSGLDKFFVLITKKLCQQGITPVFVYSETLAAVPQIRKDLEDAGAIVETMPAKGKMVMINAVCHFCKKYKPQLVDVHFVPFIKAFTAIYSCIHRVKYFIHIHSLIADCTPKEYTKKKGFIKRFLLGIYMAMLNRCGKVICVSKAIEQQFREWAYGKKDNVQTLYLGTDLTPSKLTKQQARERLGLPQDEIIFANISAKEQLKSIDYIIRCLNKGLFAHVGGLRADNEYNRTYEKSLYDLVKEIGKEKQIIWLGKRSDIKDILPAFDIYVHPSSSEGLPVSLMEAAAAGLPLIGTKVGGIPELIEHEKNGLMLEYGDWDALSKYMERLRVNKELRERFGHNAHETAYNHFDMDKQTNKLISAYGIN